MKKIAFCITCMNRLHHLQQTIEENIQDNYLPDAVEFVLLDYNSKDGLKEWIWKNMQQYIDNGMLIYYQTDQPKYYHRSHSRNMVFRLANARLVCNLDADNFFGNGFAAFMIEEFDKNENLFYTSDLSFEDIFGRVCLTKNNFLKIRGYNESLDGYGYEDVDLFSRLTRLGLIQKYFYNQDFYQVIRHSKDERVVNEFLHHNTDMVFVHYKNPYTTTLLLFKKDFQLEIYTLIDNPHIYESNYDKVDFSNEQNRVIIDDAYYNGNWTNKKDIISVQFDDHQETFDRNDDNIRINNLTFYKVNDKELRNEILMLLASAINFHKAKKQFNANVMINPSGFGQGKVYRNFDNSNVIVLQ